MTYHLLASLRPHGAMSYPLLEAVSHLMSGSTIRSNRRGDKGCLGGFPVESPPVRCDRMGYVINYLVAPLYRLETKRVKSEGIPRNSSTRTNCLWSVEGNAPVKSR